MGIQEEAGWVGGKLFVLLPSPAAWNVVVVTSASPAAFWVVQRVCSMCENCKDWDDVLVHNEGLTKSPLKLTL